MVGSVYKSVVERAFEIHRAMETLFAGSTCLTPDEIHDVRVATKELRALWQIIRPWLREEFQQAAYFLSHAAKPLSAARDAHVQHELLCNLISQSVDERFKQSLQVALHQDDSTPTINVSAESAERCRNALQNERQLWETVQWLLEHTFKTPQALDKLAHAGVRRLYRKGRRLTKMAIDRPQTAQWHELRKWVKYLGFALQLCGSTIEFQSTLANYRELGKSLGELHDLEELLLANSKGWAGCDRAHTRKARTMIRRLHRRLCDVCQRLARRLYRNRWAKGEPFSNIG